MVEIRDFDGRNIGKIITPNTKAHSFGLRERLILQCTHQNLFYEIEILTVKNINKLTDMFYSWKQTKIEVKV